MLYNCWRGKKKKNTRKGQMVDKREMSSESLWEGDWGNIAQQPIIWSLPGNLQVLYLLLMSKCVFEIGVFQTNNVLSFGKDLLSKIMPRLREDIN